MGEAFPRRRKEWTMSPIMRSIDEGMKGGTIFDGLEDPLGDVQAFLLVPEVPQRYAQSEGSQHEREDGRLHLDEGDVATHEKLSPIPSTSNMKAHSLNGMEWNGTVPEEQSVDEELRGLAESEGDASLVALAHAEKTLAGGDEGVVVGHLVLHGEGAHCAHVRER